MTDAKLGSRVLVTWLELTLAGTAGAAVGTTLGGPPGFIVYLLTTLVSVGILFYNVDALVTARLGTARDEGETDDRD
ncbi:hypothetical protein SAMN05216388_101463 [Halorientalis persicus]|jgi:hypothetical protein|uniref:Uncharacterized protein n=1 Tax=Halorientalis persicus TaxID=1367881 RepID=A0A1H8QPL8_9EURY|nr:hypothetical protein [Halorientalis persicus]SEO55938.1 hypothetical protein SAMN05216388_101463 [Halorientalis persicus]